MYLSYTKVLSYSFSVLVVVVVCTILVGSAVAPSMAIKQASALMSHGSQNTVVWCDEQSSNISPAIVELFTSQGCSSCPSADKVIADAQAEFKDNIIVLSYHVDYWDRLGWKDPFSKAIFSDRQRKYAQYLHLESVYTPQAIVNGSRQFVGSHKSAIWNAIRNQKSANHNSIETATPVITNQQLKIKYHYPALETNETIVLALVLNNATTQVKRGENSGATLSGVNIVQDIVEKNEPNNLATFNIPANFIKDKYLVVAFVQNNSTFEITSAKKIAIN